MSFLLALAAATAVPQLAGEEVRRFPAVEARQGVAVSDRLFYAIDNSTIGAYDRRTGKRLYGWRGDPSLFPHLNSCSLHRAELVCASSNYPAVPMSSSIERFDSATLRHVGSHSLGPGTGSLTWIDRHAGSWWAGFASYDGRGGEPGRDHRYTTLVRMDDEFRRTGAWLFPASVLELFKPYSNSGGVWADDGRLYVTGHDRAEVYALRLPKAGSVLVHEATIGIGTAGQAIAWNRHAPRTLWSINRATREVVATRLPALTR
jgi:outer membrane protein assembly factor BamB